MQELMKVDLAEKVGVTRQTINAIEKSKYNPLLELAFKLAKLFEVKIEDIFIVAVSSLIFWSKQHIPTPTFYYRKKLGTLHNFPCS
ncbi:hypothetical protein ES705_15750 [subsurface metagenome]